MRNECRIFVDIPERTTPPLISRRIWEVNIEMDLKWTGCEGADWIHMALDRTGGGILWTRQWTFEVHRRWRELVDWLSTIENRSNISTNRGHNECNKEDVLFTPHEQIIKEEGKMKRKRNKWAK